MTGEPGRGAGGLLLNTLMLKVSVSVNPATTDSVLWQLSLRQLWLACCVGFRPLDEPVKASTSGVQFLSHICLRNFSCDLSLCSHEVNIMMQLKPVAILNWCSLTLHRISVQDAAITKTQQPTYYLTVRHDP